MCLAIFKPGKIELPKDAIRNGWIANPDGGGYAFAHKGKITMRKGFGKLLDFSEAYEKDFKQFKSSPFVLHFRIRSAGGKEESNTHPFNIKDGVLIHNGTIDGTGAEWYKGESDTALFCKEFGDKLTYEWVKDNLADLSAAVGYNKMVMLYKNGKYAIVNEKDGVWSDDVWYSNHTFKPRPSHAPSCSTGMCS